MIEVISPAGFEHFFRELTDLTAAGPPDIAAIGTLAEAYGLQFGEAPWLPDVIARYRHPALRDRRIAGPRSPREHTGTIAPHRL